MLIYVPESKKAKTLYFASGDKDLDIAYLRLVLVPVKFEWNLNLPSIIVTYPACDVSTFHRYREADADQSFLMPYPMIVEAVNVNVVVFSTCIALGREFSKSSDSTMISQRSASITG